MFQGSEFTTTVNGAGTSSVSVTGADGIADAITYQNLVTMAYDVELERGVKPEWFLPRGAMKDITGLVDNNGRPIFNPVPVSGAPAGTLLGYPINITPVISNTPSDGDMRMAFGDPKRYIIVVRSGMNFSTNTSVKEKEGITQFIGYARGDGNLVDSAAFSVMQRND